MSSAHAPSVQLALVEVPKLILLTLGQAGSRKKIWRKKVQLFLFPLKLIFSFQCS